MTRLCPTEIADTNTINMNKHNTSENRFYNNTNANTQQYEQSRQ